MLFFACPSCKKPFGAKDEIAGRTFNCPACKQPITAPVPPDFPLLTPAAPPTPAAPGSRARLEQFPPAASPTNPGRRPS
jgi:hypothetical protein